VTIGGITVTDTASARRARRHVSLMPQHPGAIPSFSALDTVEYSSWIHEIPRKDRREACREALDRVGLSSQADKPMRKLSGGMIQRTHLAAALVSRPSLLLLDEPTLGLDPATRLSLWQTVQSARRETGAAFLVTTHYIDEVADHLSDVSVMNHGSVVATGSPATICEQYAVGEATVTVAGDSSERAVSVLAGTFPAVARDGNRIRIPSKHPNSDAALVSQTLTRNAVEMSSISIREASLEEAFLAITVTSGKEQLS